MPLLGHIWRGRATRIGLGAFIVSRSHCEKSSRTSRLCKDDGSYLNDTILARHDRCARVLYTPIGDVSFPSAPHEQGCQHCHMALLACQAIPATLESQERKEPFLKQCCIANGSPMPPGSKTLLIKPELGALFPTLSDAPNPVEQAPRPGDYSRPLSMGL